MRSDGALRDDQFRKHTIGVDETSLTLVMNVSAKNDSFGLVYRLRKGLCLVVVADEIAFIERPVDKATSSE
jgi:hypothetical protein